MNDDKFIQQRMPADCAVAALAMFLEKPYEHIAELCSGAELVRLGLSWTRENFILGLFDVEADVYAASLIDWSQPAILSVPTLNEAEGGSHSIYWDGNRVWDPQMGREGKSSYTNQQAKEFAITAIQRPAPADRELTPDG